MSDIALVSAKAAFNRDVYVCVFSDGSRREISGLTLISNVAGGPSYGLDMLQQVWLTRPELFDELDGAAHV